MVGVVLVRKEAPASILVTLGLLARGAMDHVGETMVLNAIDNMLILLAHAVVREKPGDLLHEGFGALLLPFKIHASALTCGWLVCGATSPALLFKNT